MILLLTRKVKYGHKARPGTMSWRAKLYLVFAGSRAILTAVILLILGHDRAEMLYTYAVDPIPWAGWIILWMAVGSFLLGAAYYDSLKFSTIGLAGIATLTSVWAVCLTISVVQTPGLLTVSILLWWVLLAKDLVQLRQPLSSPFEDLVKKYGPE